MEAKVKVTTASQLRASKCSCRSSLAFVYPPTKQFWIFKVCIKTYEDSNRSRTYREGILIH